MSTHKDKKIFAMTTAIAYASGKPHIGNTYERREEERTRYPIPMHLCLPWYQYTLRMIIQVELIKRWIL